MVKILERILERCPHLPLALPMNGVGSIAGAKCYHGEQGPSHWVGKSWGLPFPLDEQIEAEVWGPTRLKALGTVETPKDSTMGIRTNHKKVKPNKA